MTGDVRPVGLRTALVTTVSRLGAEQVVEAMRAGLFDQGNQPDIFTFYAAKEDTCRLVAARIRQDRA